MDLIKNNSKRDAQVTAKHFGKKYVYIKCVKMIRSTARRKNERDKQVEDLECGNA